MTVYFLVLERVSQVASTGGVKRGLITLVRFASVLTARERRRFSGSDVVYQDELDLAKARLPVATARGWAAEERFMVFGVYVAGAEIAGVYTRAGARVTGREAVFVPALLRP